MATIPINLAPEAQSTPRRSGFLRRLIRHRLAALSLVVIAVLILSCAIGPSLLPYGQFSIDMHNRFAPPFTGHHFGGTDQLGRDLLTRLLVAGRVSLSAGMAAMAISMLLGIAVGSIAGYHAGIVGSALMRVTDAALCFPRIFLVLVLAAFTHPSGVTVAIVIAATSWMETARIVEAQIRSLRSRDFALAAEMVGLPAWKIILFELLPNAIAPIVVSATLTVASAILSEATISYLGYGVQPPTPSWGNMLNSAQQYLWTAPWLAILPGLMITAAVTSFNFLGDGLRDALDPRRAE